MTNAAIFPPAAIAALLANALALPFVVLAPEARAAFIATLVMMAAGAFGAQWNVGAEDVMRLIRLAIWAPLGAYLLKRSVAGGPPLRSFTGAWMRIALVLTLLAAALDARDLWSLAQG